MENQKPPSPSVQKDRGTAFNKMSGARKVLFVCKLALCILTFGLAFPNVMAD